MAFYVKIMKTAEDEASAWERWIEGHRLRGETVADIPRSERDIEQSPVAQVIGSDRAVSRPPAREYGGKTGDAFEDVAQ
jgi:hypothetical protein